MISHAKGFVIKVIFAVETFENKDSFRYFRADFQKADEKDQTLGQGI